MTDDGGDALASIILRARAFETEAHSILGEVEAAHRSRAVELDRSYGQLSGLSGNQDELFRQALRCVENSLFRAAHVMAWAGFMDFLEELLSTDSLAAVHSHRDKWRRHKTIEDLREHVPEAQLIDVARDVKLCTKNGAKALHGLLNKRNECAHPSAYSPGTNETLGYFDEVVQRLAMMQGKTPRPS